MIQGVTFGIKHSYEDFGLILSSKEIGLPTPKTESVSVIGRNGDLDLTDALGDDVKFENRKLSFTFSLLNGARDWTATLSNLSNYLHGKKMRIVMDGVQSINSKQIVHLPLSQLIVMLNRTRLKQIQQVNRGCGMYSVLSMVLSM